MGMDAASVRDEMRIRLGQVARELGREVYPEGLPRDTKFSDLEELASALGREIARQLVETQVRGQAEEWPTEELEKCPECGGPASKRSDEPRELMTTQGKVAWKQHVAYCARCRRAFFPSEPSIGP